MKKLLLLAGTFLLAGTAFTTMPAKATLLLSQETFADLGGTGFGVAPRLLTLQNNGVEGGGTVAGVGGTTLFTNRAGALCPPATCAVHEPDTGANESAVHSLSALGWTSGAEVGIGLDTNEIGATAGLTFNTLVLTIYDANGFPLGTFSGDGPVFIDQTLLAQQQGNGNSVFDIGLDAAEQAQFDAIIAANGGVTTNLFEGLSANFGCTVPAVGCGPSSDGAESFLGFAQSAVPGPIAGAGLPGLFAAALLWFARRRRCQLTA